nr:unnamed protein product [Callosobruchus analis]CAI5866171.1 unnamed protein product [Callosobruchus analis]
MDAGHLLSAELDYELRVRGIQPVGNMDDKRKILRGLLSQERAHRSFIESFIVQPYDDDVDAIKTSLTDLEQKIAAFLSSSGSPEHKRLVSRLIHISGRINRLRTDDENQEAMKQRLLLLLLRLEAELDEKVSPATSTPVERMPPAPVFSSPKPILPYKWNISFKGTPDESVISFLEKVESMRLSRCVQKNELFLSAGDLFKDKAWIWFNVNRPRFSDWDSLVAKLKEDFLPYQYQEDLMQEINNRTQGSEERVSLYICAMEGLFNRLPEKPDEKTMVNKIRRNLLPFYVAQLALHDINTVPELTTLCKRLEESRSWSNRYKPPIPSNSTFLEPDLACSLPSRGNQRENRRMINSKSFGVSSISKDECWNCHQSGHVFSRCSSPRSVFCFGCGSQGVIRPKCPKCSGNGKGGSAKLDDATTPVQGPAQAEAPAQSSLDRRKKSQKGKPQQN